MATKLQIWQQALLHLGSAPIAAIDAPVMAVNVFSQAWLGVVEEAFTEGDWNFAMKTVEMSASTGTASVGYDYRFEHEADWVRTTAVAVEPYFRTPFYDFIDEGGAIHSRSTPLYKKYISSDMQDDAQIEAWPTNFWRLVAAKLAYETSERITQSTTLSDKLGRKYMKALKLAKNTDARNEQGKELPVGSWMRSRQGGIGRNGNSNEGNLLPAEIILTEANV